MLGKIFGVICVISVIFGIAFGNGQELANAVLDGASGAVELTISLCGVMCLWCGVMRVFERAGIINIVSKLLSPLLRRMFPEASKSNEGIGEIAANISANLLGIGNAATPFAIKAMEKLQKNNPYPERATPDMITLAVLNTASFNIIPSTLIALRRAAGSAEPYLIIVPIWICSLACSALAVLLCSFGRLCATSKRGRYE